MCHFEKLPTEVSFHGITVQIRNKNAKTRVSFQLYTTYKSRRWAVQDTATVQWFPFFYNKVQVLALISKPHTLSILYPFSTFNNSDPPWQLCSTNTKYRFRAKRQHDTEDETLYFAKRQTTVQSIFPREYAILAFSSSIYFYTDRLQKGNQQTGTQKTCTFLPKQQKKATWSIPRRGYISLFLVTIFIFSYI